MPFVESVIHGGFEDDEDDAADKVCMVMLFKSCTPPPAMSGVASPPAITAGDGDETDGACDVGCEGVGVVPKLRRPAIGRCASLNAGDEL